MDHLGPPIPLVGPINIDFQRPSAFATVLKEKRKASIEGADEDVIAPKRAKESSVMRLPASAQSGLCHQRTKDSIAQQRKLSDASKQKQRYK